MEPNQLPSERRIAATDWMPMPPPERALASRPSQPRPSSPHNVSAISAESPLLSSKPLPESARCMPRTKHTGGDRPVSDRFLRDVGQRAELAGGLLPGRRVGSVPEFVVFG